jgi:hypothetical protein
VRRLLLLIAALLPLACARPDYVESRPEWILLSAGAQPGYAIKQVVEKDPPRTLVGDDGSICRTSEERFAKTQHGAWIACAWTLPQPGDTTGVREALS